MRITHSRSSWIDEKYIHTDFFLFLDKVFIYSWLSIIIFHCCRPPVLIFIILDHARWKAMVNISTKIIWWNFSQCLRQCITLIVPHNTNIDFLVTWKCACFSFLLILYELTSRYYSQLFETKKNLSISMQ